MSNVNDPVGLVTGDLGISFVTTLTSPPIALAPLQQRGRPANDFDAFGDAGLTFTP